MVGILAEGGALEETMLRLQINGQVLDEAIGPLPSQPLWPVRTERDRGADRTQHVWDRVWGLVERFWVLKLLITSKLVHL